MKNLILLNNGYISLENFLLNEKNPNISYLSTLLQNFAYYGFVPSKTLFDKLSFLSDEDLVSLWVDIEPSMAEITFANRDIGKYVVYQNFPQEVLNLSESEYIINQFFIYFGASSSVVEDKKDRTPLFKNEKDLKVIDLTINNYNTLKNIYSELLNVNSQWTVTQSNTAKKLVELLNINTINLNDFSFKVNGISLISEYISSDIDFKIEDATDVLRLGAYLTSKNADLRLFSKFKSFSRKERKFLLNLLENSKNLEADISFNTLLFKKFFKTLHSFDYKYFSRCHDVSNLLYKNTYVKSVPSQIQSILQSLTISKHKDPQIIPCFNDGLKICNIIDLELKNSLNNIKNQLHKEKEPISSQEKDVMFLKLLNLIKSRPNEGLKRFCNIYSIFGKRSLEVLEISLKKQNVLQLLKFKKFIENKNKNNFRLVPPSGKWNKVKCLKSETNIDEETLSDVLNLLNSQLKIKLSNSVLGGVHLDESAKFVKLQSSNQELASYGRGTSFNIPENINFLRTSSYWEFSEEHSSHSVWFDNGFLFFDNNWNYKNACCWDNTHNDGSSIFSGDPSFVNKVERKSAQLIDLNIEKLLQNGTRYAVWNILSYSKKLFSEADDVLACMQFCENPQDGELYEPKRAEFSFKITGDYLTKYIAYIDLIERKIYFMDANLPSAIRSASLNSNYIKEFMPAYIEYLNMQPSVYDLFEHVEKGNVIVSYTDKNIDIDGNIAYIFDRKNEKNNFTNIDLNKLLLIE